MTTPATKLIHHPPLPPSQAHLLALQALLTSSCLLVSSRLRIRSSSAAARSCHTASSLCTRDILPTHSHCLKYGIWLV